ncbi:MAG: hypothetical protein KUL83_09885 [Lentimicrobium sp.]|jgi:hypothetical protein|nr:hypothetical protein [Lentimicrobium sp.]MDD4598987.1 hypothetical protein [Lentimicrobiaceae bacterium]HAH59402.1 hypothetical protein [Bacteroidales bacterium]
MKKFLKFFAAITVLTVISFAGLAQPNPGGNSGGGDVGGPPIGGGGTAPVGGGIVLLLTMAAGYGLKKVFDARNKFQD